MTTIRTFIGIPVASTPPLRDVLKRLPRFGRAVKPTSPDDLHLTLKFLGETPRGQVDEIAEAVRLATVGVPAHEVELIGLGAFPGPARPSVVWAGIRPEHHLQQIAERLDRLLEPLGFVPEARGFHPHLTLARVKGPAVGLAEMILESGETGFGKGSVSVVELYRSEPTPTGSRYTALAKAALGTP